MKKFLITFVLCFLCMMTVWFLYEDSWLDLGPETFLHIPVNIHHDLVGLVLMFSSIFVNKKYSEYLLGVGCALLVQHILTEGLLLVSPLP